MREKKKEGTERKSKEESKGGIGEIWFGDLDKSRIRGQRRKWRGSQGEHRRVMGFVVHLASLWPHTSQMHRDKAEPASTATTFVPPASLLDAHGNCINDNNSLLKRYPTCPRRSLLRLNSYTF